ncbi:MAG TPA: hypothetical protein VI136_14780 [Verrucomicrobiae bacterium]
MKYIPRELEKQISLAARRFPAVVLTGPHRAGKTPLLQRLLPQVAYSLLGDPGVAALYDQSYSAEFTLPPLSIIAFKPERVEVEAAPPAPAEAKPVEKAG